MRTVKKFTTILLLMTTICTFAEVPKETATYNQEIEDALQEIDHGLRENQIPELLKAKHPSLDLYIIPSELSAIENGQKLFTDTIKIATDFYIKLLNNANPILNDYNDFDIKRKQFINEFTENDQKFIDNKINYQSYAWNADKIYMQLRNYINTMRSINLMPLETENPNENTEEKDAIWEQIKNLIQ